MLRRHDIEGAAELGDEEYHGPGFCDSLPYTGSFGYRINVRGGSPCYAWECRPLPLPTDASLEALEGLLRFPFPDETVLQFSLYADDDIGTITDEPSGNNPLASLVAAEQASTAHGLSRCVARHGAALRNHRLFVTLRLPAANAADCEGAFVELVGDALVNCGLRPLPLDGQRLAEAVGKMLFGEQTGWMPTLPRLVNPAAVISMAPGGDRGHVAIDRRRFACLEITSLPVLPGELLACLLSGDPLEPLNEAGQAGCPYLASVSVLCHSRFAGLESLAGAAHNAAAVRGRRRQARPAHRQAQGRLLLPAMVLMCNESAGTLYDQAVSTGARLAAGGIGARKVSVRHPMQIIAALPGGLDFETATGVRLTGAFLGRPADLARVLPVVAERVVGYRGPLVVGRRGQATRIGLDNGDRLLVCGDERGARERLLRHLVLAHLAEGGRVSWLTTGCQRTFARCCGLDYREFAAPCPVNPLHDPARLSRDQRAAFLMELVLASENPGSEAAWSCCWQLVRHCLPETAGGDVTAARKGLAAFSATGTLDGIEVRLSRAREYAGAMAQALAPFSSGGRFGRWFNGPGAAVGTAGAILALRLPAGAERQYVAAALMLELAALMDLHVHGVPHLVICECDHLALSAGKSGDVLADALLRRREVGDTALVIAGSGGGLLARAGNGRHCRALLPGLVPARMLAPAAEWRTLPTEADLAATLADHGRYLEFLLDRGGVAQVLRILHEPASNIVTSNHFSAELDALLDAGATPVSAVRSVAGRYAPR